MYEPSLALDDAADGDADEAGKRRHRVRGVVAVAVLRLAHAADAHGRHGDSGARAEAEEHGEDDDAGARPAQRQPNAQAGDKRQQHEEEEGVEGPDHVGVVAGQHAPDDGAGVHDGQQVEGERLAEALVQGKGGDVSDGNEERELEQEDGDGDQGKERAAQDAEVRVRRRVAGRRQAETDEDADAAADEANEGQNARGPGEADAVEEVGQHEGEDDAADAAGRRREARGEATPAAEPVPDGGDARREEQRRAEAGKDAEGEDKLPELLAEAHVRDAGDDEPARAVLVEDGPDVDAAEEGQEGVDGEDPADGALAVVPQLVAQRVGLEDADCVHEAHRRHHGEPRAGDDEPGLEPALGVRLVVPARRQPREGVRAGPRLLHVLLLQLQLPPPLERLGRPQRLRPRQLVGLVVAGLVVVDRHRVDLPRIHGCVLAGGWHSGEKGPSARQLLGRPLIDVGSAGAATGTRNRAQDRADRSARGREQARQRGKRNEEAPWLHGSSPSPPPVETAANRLEVGLRRVAEPSSEAV